MSREPSQKPDSSQLRRDLRWSIRSPSLIRSTHEENVGEFPWDESYDLDTDDLQERLSGKIDRRVGHYFENLVSYYLTRIRRYELVARGWQVIEKGRTIGELDFIYRNHAGQLVHLETAVKFYLVWPHENPTGSFFIGPNASDDLDKKMRRMLEHQLPLSTRLAERFGEEISLRRAFVKGRIFYHPEDGLPAETQTRLAENHLRGTWIRRSESQWIDAYGAEARFQILRKPYWLAPVSNPGGSSAMDSAELQRQLCRHFDSSRSPVLFSVLRPTGCRSRGDELTEVDRCFVVSDQWPRQPG